MTRQSSTKRAILGIPVLALVFMGISGGAIVAPKAGCACGVDANAIKTHLVWNWDKLYVWEKKRYEETGEYPMFVRRVHEKETAFWSGSEPKLVVSYSDFAELYISNALRTAVVKPLATLGRLL